MTAFLVGIFRWHLSDEVDEALHLVVVEATRTE